MNLLWQMSTVAIPRFSLCGATHTPAFLRGIPPSLFNVSAFDSVFTL